MKLIHRNPQHLHPTRWIARLQHVTDALVRHGHTLAEIAEELGLSRHTLERARKHDWAKDTEDPYPEPDNGVSGRPPRAFMQCVESLARHLGHDCDLRRYLVCDGLRYLLAKDETQVDYREWGAWIQAHRQYLALPHKKPTSPMSGATLEKMVDEIGMNGALAREVYETQAQWFESNEVYSWQNEGL